MVVGSVAGLFYGLNRSTEDIDIVVELPLSSAGRLVDAFADDYYADLQMVQDSVRRALMFNFLPRSGGKVDFAPLKDDPWERTKFSNRVAKDWHGQEVWVTTPVDLVLSKLEWAKDSHSAKQFRDIQAIMAMGHFDENDEYFQGWLRRRGLGDVLAACRAAGHDS
jgi:hypothetical protein